MTEQSMVALVAENPVVVLVDQAKFDRFYQEMKRETDAHVPDLTTEKGRKAIASLAFKVARTKTAIDDAGKLLNEEARTKINLVDEARRRIRQQLDDLRDDVRRPLTEWEVAEDQRVARVNDVIEAIRDAGAIDAEDTSFTVEQRLSKLQATHIDDDEFQGHADIARNLLQSARDALFTAIGRLQKEEADAAELDRLRKAEAERIAKAEAERVAAEEKAESERQEKAMADAKAKAAADDLKRIEDAKAAAKLEAENRAADEKRAAEKAHADALAESERARLKLIADQKAADDARAAEAKRQADEQAVRDKDRAHRSAVMGAAKAAIIDLGVPEDVAKKIVLAIIAGEIPAVTLRF